VDHLAPKAFVQATTRGPGTGGPCEGGGSKMLDQPHVEASLAQAEGPVEEGPGVARRVFGDVRDHDGTDDPGPHPGRQWQTRNRPPRARTRRPPPLAIPPPPRYAAPRYGEHPPPEPHLRRAARGGRRPPGAPVGLGASPARSRAASLRGPARS